MPPLQMVLVKRIGLKLIDETMEMLYASLKSNRVLSLHVGIVSEVKNWQLELKCAKHHAEV